MMSRTRGKLLIALEKDRELEETISLDVSLRSVISQLSPESICSNKPSVIRKKLDDAFNQECDLFIKASSQKVEKQITKLKIQQLLEMDENEMHQKIMENCKNGKLATAQYRI